MNALDRLACAILTVAAAAMIGLVLKIVYEAPIIGVVFVAVVAFCWAMDRVTDR